MNKLPLAILLLISTFTWAADPDPADYTINVHVTTSRLVLEGTAIARTQVLNVTIDGKKYELEGGAVNVLLALGNYKAKVVKDEHKTAYDSSRTYEFLFPDQKTRKFEVIGQTE